MKKKTREFLIYIGIVVVLSVALILGGFFYFSTMPEEYEQLKYSPFYVIGQWSCSEQSMTISSYRDTSENEGEIVVELKTEEGNFYLNYYTTRGFSRKYAVSIYIYDENDTFQSSCHYNFEEESFSLFDFSVSEDATFKSLFKSFSSLNFNKTA